MEEVRIPRGQTAKLGPVEGDLTAEDRVLIQAAEGSKVVVSGKAVFEGSAELDCDFECKSLESGDGLLRVNGNLLVHEGVDVEEALYVRGGVEAQEIEVGGKLSVGKSLKATKVEAGGLLEVLEDITADSVEVGGSFEARGEAKLRDLNVGGKAELWGGEVTGTIEVGGRFGSRKVLRFNSIESGGVVELNGGEGKSIEVGGKLESHGDLKCERIEAGGFVEVEGSLSGRSAEVGGKVRVTGDLALAERLEVGGIAEIGGVVSGADVEVGGGLKASKGLLSGRAEIGGRVETTQGFKANRIDLGKGARCVGTLVGGVVHLEKRSEVQDVYCSRLVAEGGTKLGKVHAEIAEIGDHCIVEELVYTQVLRQGEGVTFLSQPQKSERLPPFPI